MSAFPTPWQRLRDAAEHGDGLSLTVDEVRQLVANDPHISMRAGVDDELQAQVQAALGERPLQTPADACTECGHRATFDGRRWSPVHAADCSYLRPSNRD